MCPKYLLRFYRCKRGLNLHSRYAKAVVLSFLQHHLEQRYTLANGVPPSHPSRYAKTLLLPFPQCQNISCYAETLFLPFPQRQNTFLAIPATPKHFSCHTPYTNTLYLVTPGNAWSPPGNTWYRPGSTWYPPGNIWLHLVTSNSQISLSYYITKRCQ